METKKMNFFSRMFKAIVKFDEYEYFVNEKFLTAISYIFKLVLIVALLVSLVLGFTIITQMKDIVSTAEESLPEFKFADYKLTADEIKEVKLFDDVFLIIDTNPEIEQETVDNYKSKLEEYQMGFLVLNDKVYLKRIGFDEYNYEQLMESYNIEKTDFTKQEAIDYIKENVLDFKTYLVVFLIIYFVFLLTTVISLASDIMLLSILGFFTSRICKVDLKFIQIASIAIYSITLPLLLLGLYQVALSLFNFKMDYFNIMYLSIGYIYVVAAILIMKSDKMKQVAEVQGVVKVQKELDENDEVKPQDETKEDDKKDKKEDKNDEEKPDINTNEPDGSEV